MAQSATLQGIGRKLCPFGTRQCTGRYHRPADGYGVNPAAGELCESDFAIFETRDPGRRLSVSHGRWHDDVESVPLVWLGEYRADAPELDPGTARRLAVALLVAADLADQAAGTDR